MFVFAFISHFAYVFASMDFVDWKSFIPFYYGSALNQTSVMWSLAWGLVMLRVVNSKKIESNMMKVLLIVLICLISFPSDWSCVASLCILAFGTNRGNLKKEYIRRILDGNAKCECCGITDWNNKVLEFQIHHINGYPKDNKVDNLILLCPNCHSQTDNFSNKKRRIT